MNDNSSPSYLKDLITVYFPQTQRCLRSSQINLLDVLRKKLKKNFWGKIFFAPEVWNKLPEYLKSSRFTAILKTNHKTYLFRCSYEPMCFLSLAVLIIFTSFIIALVLNKNATFNLNYLYQPYMHIILLFTNVFYMFYG